MGKFDGILICTDLDGTLYKKDKTISKENKEAIRYFKSEGGSFTFITGRLPFYSTDAYNAVDPNVPYGCVNGAGVYDGKEGRYVWTLELEREALELLEYIDERFPGIGFHLCCFDKIIFVRDNETTIRFRRETGLPNIKGGYKGFTEPIGKINLCSEEEEIILEMGRLLNKHKLASKFDFIRSERAFYEILPKGASKGLALQKIAEHLGIDIKKTIAIGDYDNDISMIRAAGCGVAVANASKPTLDAADIVTVSNEEHAIARVIYDLENGKIRL